MQIRYFSTPPLVSIIIPTYNRGHFIPQALASLESQSFKEFEVIVCDDGSTDCTAELVTTYARSASYPLRYIWFSHRGAARARNIGLRLANGRYIALLDSDDTYHTDKLAAQLEVMEQHPEAVFCYTGYRLMHTDVCIDPGEFQRDRFKSANYLCCASVLMRQSAVVTVGGYDPRLSLAEDWDLLIRLSLTGPVLHIPNPMYEYYLHPGQITRQSILLDHFTNMVRCRYGGKEIGPLGYLNVMERERTWHKARFQTLTLPYPDKISAHGSVVG